MSLTFIIFSVICFAYICNFCYFVFLYKTIFSSMKRRLNTRTSILNVKCRRLSNQTFENSTYKDANDDEDVIILEENSTPKPSVDIDVEMKSEVSHVEQSGARGESSGNSEACMQTSSTGTSATSCDQGTSTSTQTEVPSLVVKKEEVIEDAIDARNDGVALPPCGEAEGKKQEVQKPVEKSVGDADCQLSELRNQLLLITQEKENYERQCHAFTDQIRGLQQSIAELNDRLVKKEMCHQSTETDAVLFLDSVTGKSESPNCIASQYQQALEEIERLKRQCSTLQLVKTECGQCSSTEGKSEVDEMVVQLDNVFRQLDRCTVERDQYKNKVSAGVTSLYFCFSAIPLLGWEWVSKG